MCESILVLGNNCLNYGIYMKVFWATGWRSWRRPTSSWSCLSSKLRAGELRLHLVDIKVCVRVFSREDKADDHNNAMRLLIIVQQSEGTASIFKSPHIWSVVGRWHCDFADWPEKENVVIRSLPKWSGLMKLWIWKCWCEEDHGVIICCKEGTVSRIIDLQVSRVSNCSMMIYMMMVSMMVMVMMVWICGQHRGGIRISFQLLVQLHLSTNPNLQRSWATLTTISLSDKPNFTEEWIALPSQGC